MKNIAIVGGRVVDPYNHIDSIANIYIENGKIKAISSSSPPNFQADRIINATGCLICPGLVDLNANVLSPQVSPTLFISNLENAVMAGITHLATSAFTADRCLRASEITQFYQLSLQAKKTKAYFIGALTQELEGNRLNELMLLKEAGCIGFSNGYHAIPNNLVKKRCYEYAAMLNLKIFIVPEDSDLSQVGGMHEGKVNVRLGLPGIPVLSESIALAKELMLIEDTGIQAHFYRISAGKSVTLLEAIGGLTITSDVAIHQLYLTDNDVRLENGLCHVRPPFRSHFDLEALRRAVKQGYITAISSDHITLLKEAKEVPFQGSEPGIASWPLLLPLTLRLVKEENIALSDAISRITSGPAAILGIDAGHMSLNSGANLIIVDPEQSWTLSAQDLAIFGMNNPFIHYQLQGKVIYTVVDGQIVYESH